ncbi:hypothetical protein FS837_005183 [Tulasnella sp. UAMH 9824]|nr:hypothetical protein FS837_005183 [Tulasnella sp. UAMH 9824]
MESFAADLLESVEDLDARNPSGKPPSSTIDEQADKNLDLDAAQDTQSGLVDELKSSSLRARLDRLSGLRIHTDAITSTSSEAHGSGGKAEVVKATVKLGDSSDEQQVAVKKLRYSDDINGRKFGKEFVHEVDIMTRLSHQNIVKLIGFVEDLQEGKAWIVLSWESNGNVREFLAKGEWEIPERISLIQDTFAGIKYLHTHKPPICHGDLKSLNILVSASYRAVLTDFGSARILKEAEDRQGDRDKVRVPSGASTVAPTMDQSIERTQVTIVTGRNQLTLTGPAWSLLWAAPEVVLGESPDSASDIWAAGWICWEVMTNKVPFQELNSEGAIALKVVEGHVPVVREDTQLSQIIRLCSLMTDCWAFDPQKRPHIARCYTKVQQMPSLRPSGRKISSSDVPSAELLCKMGSVYRSQSSYKQATSLFQQALSIATSTGDQMISASALLQLGRVYHSTSKLTDAEHHLTQAQKSYAQIGSDFDQAVTLLDLAKVYRDQNKLTKAEKAYARARDTFARTSNDHGQAMALHGLGSIFQKRAQYSEAEELYNQARNIHAQFGYDQDQANTLRRLGVLCSDRSEYTKAEEYFNQALAMYTRTGDMVGRANVLYALGRLFHVQGLNTKAAPLFAESRSIYSQIGDSKWEKRCTEWLDAVSKQGESSTTSPSVV